MFLSQPLVKFLVCCPVVNSFHSCPENVAMLRTIMFDLGNVLLYFSHERMFEQMGALCGKPAEETRELMLDSLLDFEIGPAQPLGVPSPI